MEGNKKSNLCGCFFRKKPKKRLKKRKKEVLTRDKSAVKKLRITCKRHYVENEPENYKQIQLFCHSYLVFFMCFASTSIFTSGIFYFGNLFVCFMAFDISMTPISAILHHAPFRTCENRQSIQLPAIAVVIFGKRTLSGDASLTK